MKTYTNKPVFLLIAILFIFATKSFSQEPMQTLEMPWEFPIQSLAFSPDGEKMLVGSLKPVLWDLNTNQILHIYDDSSFDIRAVAFSSDGKYIAAGADGFMVMVWETETNGRIAYFQTQTHIRPKVGTGPVLAVAFSPDNKYLFTSDWYGDFYGWELDTLDSNRLPNSYEIELQYSMYLNKLIGLSGNRIALIDPVTYADDIVISGGIYPHQLLKNDRVIYHQIIDGEGRYIIYNFRDKKVDNELPPFENLTYPFRISENEELMALPGYAHTSNAVPRRILDFSTGKELRKYNKEKDSPKGSPESTDDMIRFLPDGKHLLTVNYHKMYIYDISDLTSFIKNSEKY
jgi:hypothetical protein